MYILYIICNQVIINKSKEKNIQREFETIIMYEKSKKKDEKKQKKWEKIWAYSLVSHKYAAYTELYTWNQSIEWHIFLSLAP